MLDGLSAMQLRCVDELHCSVNETLKVDQTCDCGADIRNMKYLSHECCIQSFQWGTTRFHTVVLARLYLKGQERWN